MHTVIQFQLYTNKWSVAVELGVIILTTYIQQTPPPSPVMKDCHEHSSQGDDNVLFLQHQDSLVVTVQLNP